MGDDDRASSRAADGPATRAAARETGRASGGRISRPRLWWLAGVLLIVLVLPFDTAISEWFADVAADGTYLRRAFKLLAHVLAWWSFIPLGVLLLLFPQRKKLLTGFGVTLAGCIGTLHTLKFLVGRARPGTQIGGVTCGPFYVSPLHGFDSFPSGEAATAMLLAALLGLYVPRLRWFVVPLAVLVGLCRVVLKRHYLSDVIGGSELALLAVALSIRFLGPDHYPALRLSDLKRGS